MPSPAVSQPPTSELSAKLSRIGRDAGLRVAARRPDALHHSDEAIDAALDAYEDEVYRDFHHPHLTLDQRQRLRSLIVEVLTAALVVSSTRRSRAALGGFAS